MIKKNLSIEDYHYSEEYTEYLSASSIKEAKKSLKAFKRYQDSREERERKIHFDFGNAFELALVDLKEYTNKVTVLNADLRPSPEKTFAAKDNKAWKLDIEAEATAQNHYLINEVGDHSAETIQRMLVSCNAEPTIKALLSKVEYQYSFFWKDAETGLKLKTRPDVSIVNKNNLIDIKTTDDASPRAVANAISKFNYPTQACMQIDGVQQTGYIGEVDNYFWLFVEKKAPFDAVLYEFSKEDRALKMADYKRTLKAIAIAKESNKYPGYSAGASNDYGILTAKIY